MYKDELHQDYSFFLLRGHFGFGLLLLLGLFLLDALQSLQELLCGREDFGRQSLDLEVIVSEDLFVGVLLATLVDYVE